MHEGTGCPHQLVCGQGCGEGPGAAASCSSSAGLWGFTPRFSSTFCRRNSFLEGIMQTGLALFRASVLCLGSGHPTCTVGSWGGSSLLDTLPCFFWAFSTLMCELCLLDTRGCSESPLSTREWVSPLPSSGQPKSLPALVLSPWPGVGRAAGQGSRGVGCALPVGPWAPPADEIRGAEPLHPLGQVSALWAERAPGTLRTPRCWSRRSSLSVQEQRGSELGFQRTEMQPRGTLSLPSEEEEGPTLAAG